jgi:hypothetical protein
MRHMMLTAVGLVMLLCIPSAASERVYGSAPYTRLVAGHAYRDWDREDHYWRHCGRDDWRHWKHCRHRRHYDDRDDYYWRHRDR